MCHQGLALGPFSPKSFWILSPRISPSLICTPWPSSTTHENVCWVLRWCFTGSWTGRALGGPLLAFIASTRHRALDVLTFCVCLLTSTCKWHLPVSVCSSRVNLGEGLPLCPQRRPHRASVWTLHLSHISGLGQRQSSDGVPFASLTPPRRGDTAVSLHTHCSGGCTGAPWGAALVTGLPAGGAVVAPVHVLCECLQMIIYYFCFLLFGFILF